MLRKLRAVQPSVHGEDKPADQAAASKPAPAKKQVTHDHAATHKQGTVPAAVDPAAEPKKPLHDHQKVHK